jgi:hypothetical protein
MYKTTEANVVMWLAITTTIIYTVVGVLINKQRYKRVAMISYGVIMLFGAILYAPMIMECLLDNNNPGCDTFPSMYYILTVLIAAVIVTAVVIGLIFGVWVVYFSR